MTASRRRARVARTAIVVGAVCALSTFGASGCTGAGITTPARGTGREAGESRVDSTHDTGPTRIAPGGGSDAGTDATMTPPPPPPAAPLPASCEEVVFEPCGGDPVGTWAVRLGCVDYEDRAPFPDCPDGTLDIEIVISGALEIRAGNTYSSATDIASVSTARVPTACAGADCSGLGDGARLEAGLCVQTATDHQMPTDEGVWRFEGGLVVLQTAGESTAYQHCVEGDRLTLVAPATGPNDSRVTLVLERM